MAYDRVLIRDLGSRNGVRVNGRAVDESRLQHGDELAIGPILFRLETEVMMAEAPRPAVVRPAAPPRATRPDSPTPGRPPLRPPISPSAAADSETDLVPLDD
jgi:pSer/pThr/pTyr-binding forkhead associated (FHA) protein